MQVTCSALFNTFAHILIGHHFHENSRQVDFKKRSDFVN